MNAEYEKQIGEKIRQLRISKGITQDALTARLQVYGCDITRSALAKIEVAQRHIYPDELKALKYALNIRYEDILE